MTRRINVVALIAGVALAGSLGCTTKQTAPAISGPSELATAITIYASPDTITQDGASQSQITILARDARNQPIANLPIRLETTANGVVADFGQLSTKQLTTGGDGRATTSYTAPNAPQSAADVLSSVTILVTPVGADAAGATTRSVTIRLTSSGIVIPPSNVPRAEMAFSPANPLAGADVVFDGARSTVTGARIVSYAWDFGDGTAGSGSPVSHRYMEGGAYKVRLTVADDRGLTGTTTGDISVRDTASPTASFVSSPANPVVHQRILFNGTASTAAPGRTIVSYAWDFGNQETATGANAATSYPTVQEYLVSLTVTDDLGKRNTATHTVSIRAAELLAKFTFLPSSPFGSQDVTFDGSASSGTYPIDSYAWSFGDGVVATGQLVQHAYAPSPSQQSYVARLTITDNTGQTSSSTQVIVVKAGNGLTATFSFSPTDAIGAQSVRFNAAGSSGPNAITSYAWDFGDTTIGSAVIVDHSFLGCTGAASAATSTFVVRLTVTDSVGQTAATTQSVPIKLCR